MLRLVLATGAVLAPLAGPILKRRLKRGKEDPARWREKLGEPGLARPEGTLVWLHGVGVGEVMALRGLIAQMRATRPELRFLVTSSARSSAQVIEGNLPDGVQHQYLPLDFPGPVRAFLDHWRPDLAVWSDQEIWPRLAVTLRRRGVPQALVAARITDASARAKTRFGGAFGDLYRLLDLRHAQEARTAGHLADLMGDDTPVEVSGSLKAAAAVLADDPALRAEFDGRGPVWVAASAHPADMEVAIAAQALLRDRLLILAPRDMGDVGPAVALCDAAGLSWAKRSEGSGPCEVLIADSFGELGIWYRLADVALIGGTFDGTEGHNPWEAVALETAVLHGPRVRNFEEDFAALNAADAALLVPDAAALAEALRDPELRAMITRASAVRNEAAQGTARIAADLLKLLD